MTFMKQNHRITFHAILNPQERVYLADKHRNNAVRRHPSPLALTPLHPESPITCLQNYSPLSDEPTTP